MEGSHAGRIRTTPQGWCRRAFTCRCHAGLSGDEIERCCVSGLEQVCGSTERLNSWLRRGTATHVVAAVTLAVVWLAPAIGQTAGTARPDAPTAGTSDRATADRFRREGKLDEADRALTALLADEPENASLWFARGEVRALQGRHINAAADFSAAVRYAPQHARAYAARSEQLRLLGALPRAIEDATAAIRIDPRFAQAYAARAYALQRLGRNAEAHRDADTALEHDAVNPLALLARGLARERPEPDAARRDIERALALGLQSPVATAALLRLGGPARR